MPGRRGGALLCASAEELIVFVQLQDYPHFGVYHAHPADTGAFPGRILIREGRGAIHLSGKFNSIVKLW
jgi:hypothetical protein